MSNISFSQNAWNDYLYWQTQDKKTLKKINNLLKDIQRNANDGIGNPERLSGNLSDCFSRRIDEKNRLVYKIENDNIIILQCATHYNEK